MCNHNDLWNEALFYCLDCGEENQIFWPHYRACALIFKVRGQTRPIFSVSQRCLHGWPWGGGNFKIWSPRTKESQLRYVFKDFCFCATSLFVQQKSGGAMAHLAPLVTLALCCTPFLHHYQCCDIFSLSMKVIAIKPRMLYHHIFSSISRSNCYNFHGDNLIWILKYNLLSKYFSELGSELTLEQCSI